MSTENKRVFDLNSEEDNQRWGQEQYAKVQKYCQKNQLPIQQLDQTKSRVLPPIIAIWNVELATKPASTVWVIGGEVMMDHVSTKAAGTPREALRHFSLSWQMKSSTLERTMNPSLPEAEKEQQQKVIEKLINEAEALYDLYANDQLWA